MNGARFLIALLAMGISAASWAYPWDKDMVDQPSPKAQRDEAPPEPGAMPVEGGETVPLPADDDEGFRMKDEAAALQNPVPANAESIARGKAFYEMTCLVCHGASGTGDGPVADKFAEKAPVDLTDAYVQDQADGQIFFTLTRGRATMPFYRDALSPAERWDVINYVRSEFGR